MPTPLVARRSSRAETCSPDLAKCEMRCGAVPCSAVPGCNPGWAASVGTLTQVSTYLASRCSCTSSQRKVDRPASSPPSRQALNFVASPACKTNIAHCLSVDPFFRLHRAFPWSAHASPSGRVLPPGSYSHTRSINRVSRVSRSA